MAKTKVASHSLAENDDDPVVEYVESSSGKKSNTACCVSVIAKGRVIAFFPSAELDQHMRTWPGARAKFGRTATGRIKSIQLTEANGGPKVRHYQQRRPSIHLRVLDGGTAKCVNASKQQTCAADIQTDGTVLVTMPSTISFEPAPEASE
jgi:hypothetical protein